MISHSLSITTHYQGVSSNASWRGVGLTDSVAYRHYLQTRIRPRINDEERADSFGNELQGLASTGMASQFVEKLLKSVPKPIEWEIGEALAECLTQDHSLGDVIWPWNTVRDRRTPRASLPGADLVGFFRQDDDVYLLIGEVKTSSDKNSPPNVMYGAHGLTWQLEENATRLDVQCALLIWLRNRCESEEHKAYYRSAVSRYINTNGKDLLLVGILLRDTDPDEKDVKSRALALATTLSDPTQIEITAWYLPIPISEWAVILGGGTP